MATLDWLIIVAYLGVVGGLAAWVFRRRKDTPDDYFLANRNLGWFIVGASIFASNIGSEHLVGLAGSGATDGVALAHYELHAWCLLVLAWVFVPLFMRSRVYTMPEFLERRFSLAARWVLSLISLVSYVLTKIAVGIFAGGVVFATLLPDVQLQLGPWLLNSFWVGSLVVIVLTGIYTVAGGMRAVAYTEVLQTLVLVVGSGLLTWFGLSALGGWGGLREALDPDLFNLWKPIIPEGMDGTWAPVLEPNRIAWYFNGDFPWPGMLLCAPIIGLWYWCTDQYIVQRALGARNETEARRGSIFAGMLKLLPVFIFIIPGMIALALARTGDYGALSQMVDADGNVIPGAAQAAFPLLVTSILPVGVRGLVVAGLLARIDEFAGGRIQRLVHALHDGPLPEMAAEGLEAAPVLGGAGGHLDDGRYRFAVDPGHPGLPGPLRVSAGCTGVPGAADLHGLLPRRLHEAPERQGMPGRAGRRVRAGGVPVGRRHAGVHGDGGLRGRVRSGIIPVDRQQHLLPVLQPLHLHRLGGGHGRSQLPDRAAVVRTDLGADLCHGDRRAPCAVAHELGPAGRAGVRPGPGHDHHGLPVLPRLSEA